MPEHEKKDKRRGPIRKSDKLELPEEKQAGSAGPESSGDQAEEQPQSETQKPEHLNAGSAEDTPASSTHPSSSQATGEAEETPAMRQLREQHEAKAADEEDRGKHPYVFQVNNAAGVPFALRDPMTGNPSREKIEEHLQYCWNIGATPVINGVMVGERVK